MPKGYSLDGAPNGKECPTCKTFKPREGYYKSKATKTGLQVRCKECCYKTHARYRTENLAKTAERAREWRKNNAARASDHGLKHHYNLPIGTYDKMFAQQNGRCAICGAGECGGNGKRFYVDHCHSTGRVRGLLCHHCNFGLGHFSDSPERLAAAIRYLAEG